MEGVRGLNEKEIEVSQKKYGKNVLTKKERATFWKKYSEKFEDPIIVILLVALGINVVFTFLGKADWFECFGIFLSVLISTFVGTISEYKNEETFQKIQEEAEKRSCKVYRSEKLMQIACEDVVVGDFVLLQSGDMVPADGIVYMGEVMADQSALNGENKEIKKTTANNNGSHIIDFWDKSSLLRGVVVCSGQCIMKVTRIGDDTVYGRLNCEASAEARKSPLQVKLAALAKKISIFGYIGATAIMAFCMLGLILKHTGGDASLLSAYFADKAQLASDAISSLILGITVIVVAVPEGLPLMIAIVCSLNMKKMLKSNVMVRKLIGIETAGSIDILFSDKTGTITSGRLKATCFVDGSGKETHSFGDLSEEFKKLVYISSIGNSAAKYSGKKVLGGNATERALLEFAKDFSREDMKIKKIDEILFSSEKKYSVAWVDGDFKGGLVKGAPEKILAKCTTFYDENGKKQSLTNVTSLKEKTEAMARRSIRVLALATAEKRSTDELPDKMTLVGLVGIRDELRKEVKDSVLELRRAGIQTVMITGDKKETAVSVAKEAGIIDGERSLVLTSDEIKDMDDECLKKLIPDLRVVARALPSDKSRLVRLAQEIGMVAGMTGDGVNDLSALRLADVGFAMGSGTDVAKEAGDIVILDNDFSSIKKAVLYGRTIYKSIKKFITFQMTINIAAVAVLILGPIIGIDKPLGIVQMLWINLVMDTLAAIAFGGEAPLRKYMLEKPRKRDEDIMDKKMWSAIGVGAVFISAVSVFMFISQDMYYAFRASENDAVFYTGYFSYFVFSCIFNAFNTRTDEVDLLDHISLNKPFIAIILLICAVQIFMTYFGGAVIGTADLSAKEWSIVIVMALLVIPVDILRKLIVAKVK